MDDATGAYLLIGVVTRSFLMLFSVFSFWQRVARFNGLKVTPVFKQGPTSSLALRTVASRRCHPRHISAAVSNTFTASPTADLSFIFSELPPKDSSRLIRVDLLWRARLYDRQILDGVRHAPPPPPPPAHASSFPDNTSVICNMGIFHNGRKPDGAMLCGGRRPTGCKLLFYYQAALTKQKKS